VCAPQDAQSEKKTKHLAVVPKYEECFMVKHYCGQVMYTVQDFVSKSRDALLPHLHEVMVASTKPNIKILFSDDGSGESETVGEKFCGQLRELAEKLDSGETCFVRCIKSNARKLPGTVHRPMVLEQLLHGGVVAALEMRRSGLPERMEYNSFNREFQSLERCACGGVYIDGADDHCRKCKQRRVIDSVQRAKAIVQNVVGSRAQENRDFAFGNTKVFMSTKIDQFLKAVLKLRWKHYANVVVARWRFAMCAVKIRAIEESWNRLQAAEQLAQEGSISELSRIKTAFKLARQKLEPPYCALQKEKSKYPTLESMGGNEKKQMFKLIAAAIGDCPGVKHAATIVETEVQRVVERKAKARDFRLMRVQNALDQLPSMLEIVERVETDCVELLDVVEAADMEKCRSACEQARAGIMAAQTVELPALQEQLPRCVDLESDGPLEGDPDVAECLARVQVLVREADGFGQEILAVRAAFLLVVRELEDQRTAKLRELSDLQTTEFVEAGLSKVVEVIDIAWQRSAVVDDLLNAAKDGEAYRAAVEAFLVDVDNSKRAVADARELLGKVKQERAERRRLYAAISDRKEKLREALGSLTETEIVSDPAQVLKTFFFRLKDLIEEAAAVWEAGHGECELADWRANVEAWDRRAQIVLEELAAQQDKVLAQRRSKFASRMAVFGQSPATRPPVPVKESVARPRCTAADKVASEGLQDHSEQLLQIANLVEELQTAGADRSGVQSCLSHFVLSAYRGGTNADTFSPPRQTTRFINTPFASDKACFS